MKLVVYYPDESSLKRAEEAWQRFVERVQPPPVEVTDIYWAQAPEPSADAIAEAEADQDLPGDQPLMLRLSAQFFRLSPSSQLVTLLHETIRMSLELTGKRLQQADDLSQGHFQGKTRSEQAFETQRIELARGLYLFPDEVMAEKHLQQDYPAFAADRLGHYNDIQGRTSENRDYETAEPGLEWPAALWFWLRNKLGAVGLEFLVRPPSGAGPVPGSARPNALCRVRCVPPDVRWRNRTACGHPTMRGFWLHCSTSETRSACVRGPARSRTARGREILAAPSH